MEPARDLVELHREMHRQWDAGDHNAAGRLGREVLRGWPGPRSDRLVACTHATVGMVAFRRSEFPPAARHLGIAATPENRERVALNSAWVCNALAMTDVLQGRYDRVDELLDYMLRNGRPVRQASACRLRASVVWGRDADLDAATGLLEQAVTLDPPGRSGLVWSDAASRAAFLVGAGRPDDAVRFLAPMIDHREKEIRGSRESTHRPSLGSGLLTLAQAYLDCDQAASAELMWNRAQPFLGSYAPAIARSLLIRADLAARSGDFSGSAAAIQGAQTIASSLGLRPTQVDVHELTAQVRARQGDDAAARRELRLASELATRLGLAAALLSVARTSAAIFDPGRRKA